MNDKLLSVFHLCSLFSRLILVQKSNIFILFSLLWLLQLQVRVEACYYLVIESFKKWQILTNQSESATAHGRQEWITIITTPTPRMWKMDWNFRDPVMGGFAGHPFLHPKLQSVPTSSYSYGDFLSNGPSNHLFSSRFVFLHFQTSLLSLFPIKKLFSSILFLPFCSFFPHSLFIILYIKCVVKETKH